jgi:hypothetical protein
VPEFPVEDRGNNGSKPRALLQSWTAKQTVGPTDESEVASFDCGGHEGVF